MQTSTLIVGEGSEELTVRAREVANEMLDAIPESADSTLIIGAMGLLTVSIFNSGVEREHRLTAFDAYYAHCRKQIERETVS